MEDLIKQAFLHVDVIGQHVHDGHYDLVGPDGEIILPQVWEVVIQPDWAITMHMWPMPEPPPPPPEVPMAVPVDMLHHPAGPIKHGKGKDKKVSKKRHSMHDVVHPPPPPAGMVPPPPPPPPPPPAGIQILDPNGGLPLPPMVMPAGPSGSGEPRASRRAVRPSPLMKWMAGGRSQSSKGLKKPEGSK